MSKTNVLEKMSEEVSLITQKVGTLSGNLEFIAMMIEDRNIIETIELWRDYAEGIYSLLYKLKDEFEEITTKTSNKSNCNLE